MGRKWSTIDPTIQNCRLSSETSDQVRGWKFNTVAMYTMTRLLTKGIGSGLNTVRATGCTTVAREKGQVLYVCMYVRTRRVMAKQTRELLYPLRKLD